MSMIPPAACLGVSHRTAPLALRERLAFGPEALRAFYNRVRGEQREGAPELLLLSTCNRTELFVGPVRQMDHVRDGLLDLLAADRGVPRPALERASYVHTGQDVARHLGRVAAGADSMIFGEAEILGQVRDALHVAREAGVAGPFMTALVKHAVRAGRRARTETEIGRCAGSVAAEAVRAVGERVALSSARVVLVGAGAVARTAGLLFGKHGARSLKVVTRTTGHGARLARTLGGTALPWHDLPRAVADADIVLTATSAPHALITVELVRAVRGPGSGPLAIVDISVPRNVEPGVARIPQVTLLDLDQLQKRVEANLAARRGALPAVEAIVEQEAGRFAEWQLAHAVRPVLSAMHARGETIRRAELDRLLARLGDVDAETREAVEQFSRALVTKLLHEPSRSLRQDVENAAAARRLFGLGDIA